MPRSSKQQAIQHRLAIEEASARLFREQGFRGVSVSDLMAAAGLTHGGFYGHFNSKDELMAIACTNAFEASAARWKGRVNGQAVDDALAAIVEPYLSRASRDAVGTGCPIVSLATDVAREPEDRPVKDTYVSGVKNLLKVLLQVQTADSAKERRTNALAQLSLLVGGMLLARATRNDKISDEFLNAAKSWLLNK